MSRLVCQRCGKCCNDLIQQDRGVLRGLSLMLEEIHLFTEELVKPYLGIGKRPHMTNFKVIAYQLASDSCPHLVENSCRRYDERPTSCRQFPFSLDLDEENEPLLGMDMNCPAAVELITNIVIWGILLSMITPAPALGRSSNITSSYACALSHLTSSNPTGRAF